MKGNRIAPKSAALIKDFIDANEPIDNIEAIADAAVTPFGALTPSGAPGSEMVSSRLFGGFVSAYDVFIWGKGYTRNTALKVKKTAKGLAYFAGGDYHVPKHTDAEIAVDPYRIAHSRIELSVVPYADWLQVTEYIRNPQMRPEDTAWQGAERARGILTVGDTERLFIMILRGDHTRGARIYLLQPHSEDYEKPPEERRYLGGIVTRTDDGFPTSASAANVQFVPVTDQILTYNNG
ncbi:MAG: hypothetical protein NXH88_17765 [Hyphomonas sp.]|nr:hypothetical protein [Hyphomonas sp.]